MPEAEPRVRGLAASVPVVAAAALYGWAHWCYADASAPSGTVALAGGAVLVVGASVVYFACVGGSRSVFGALFLALGLLLTVTATDQAAARAEVALCAVRDVQEQKTSSAGEGLPGERIVYRHVLNCPGGYPDELTGDRRIAAAGGEIRVAYDPRHRVSPALEGANSPWAAGLGAVVLLALSALLAGVGRIRDA
ncbi:hypothetical protein [Streptomyces sp. NBC_01006]|uniref:hypothetical protein n=1 Tax=Streptomyces sp. NBC_01006 TaxID=2903716 RepID=UPI00386ED7CC|nr:hypothetical protein OG509_36920 [Streptomyces sp. NBC_01006]